MKAKVLLAVILALSALYSIGVGLTLADSDRTLADPAEWGKKYPIQYGSYLENYKEVAQPFGGSVERSRLEEHPSAYEFYKGLGFAIEFNASRGHVYALEDVKHVARPKAAAICLTCKTSALPYLVEEYGVEGFYRADFKKTAEEAAYPISCANCHNPDDMTRRINNPALKAALAQDGKDLEELSQEDMRMLACAQCHVEYYFTYSELILTLPWANGTEPHAIEAYYDSIGFSDWKHPDSGVGLLKVQHPEYETYKDSIHSMMGLTCADCHMPPAEKGGIQYTSHWWTSPLNHIEQSPCIMCHGGTAAELRERVLGLQEVTSKRIDVVGEALADLHKKLASKKAALAGETYITVASLIRKAQFRLDWVFSENSTGFHNNAMLMGLLDEAEAQIAEARKLLE